MFVLTKFSWPFYFLPRLCLGDFPSGYAVLHTLFMIPPQSWKFGDSGLFLPCDRRVNQSPDNPPWSCHLLLNSLISSTARRPWEAKVSSDVFLVSASGLFLLRGCECSRPSSFKKSALVTEGLAGLRLQLWFSAYLQMQALLAAHLR